MSEDDTKKFEANCVLIRQLKALRKNQWDHYTNEIDKVVEQNEALLNTTRTRGVSTDAKETVQHG